ncbi:MAG: DNA gyrase subunit A [Chloroflexota bacterium]|nr:MAG: DNA gyrase subunit A [Chloroflexota bacterium]
MEIGTVRLVNVEDEMKASYLDYAMSVIVSRALPDVRDGLKPVHRRILYAMDGLSLHFDSPYKKSARIVGEVLGKYHPHGDAPVYDAMVRMAQDFSMRYPLIDGQGNFGSVDNDPPAAMRYTEARMAALAEELLADIDKDTVDFTDNFDGSLKEPLVLPGKVPNLLVNGSAGIAVGMATNIPPHNLTEVCNGIAHLIEHPDATVEDLVAIVQGPDFPTAGIILGTEGIKSAYSTGHGRIVVRARAHIEEMSKGGRMQIIVTELPFQVNKAGLIEKMADLVKEKKIEGISELRDESDRQGMRIVIELRKDCKPKQVLNNLYKHTAMQSAFSVNMLALVDGAPRVLTLKMVLQQYLNHRREVITRRTQFELQKAKDRAHILEGLRIALDNLDAIISTIRKSQTAESARNNLMKDFKLTQIQAQAILDMQLRRLAALERKKIMDEYAEVLKTIAYLEDLLANPQKILYLIRDELGELKERFGDARRTRILKEELTDFTEEDLIPDQEMVVSLSTKGYIKRVSSDTYRSQRRGGRGITGVVTREAESVQQLLVTSTHSSILFFTDRGRVFQSKCHEIPDSSRQAKGLPLINLIALDQNEAVTAMVAVRNFEQGHYLVLATRRGEIKKTAVDEFASVRSSGIIAMDLEEGDALIVARAIPAKGDVIMVTQQGQSIRFPVAELRSASRASGGVRGIRLEVGDRLVAMDVVDPEADLLVVSSAGYGKRTALSEYTLQGRGGGGIRTLKVTPKTGDLVAARVVTDADELMIVSSEGIVLRTPIGSIQRYGRSSQGVSLMRVEQNDRVASIAIVRATDGDGPETSTDPGSAPTKGRPSAAEKSRGSGLAIDKLPGSVPPKKSGPSATRKR